MNSAGQASDGHASQSRNKHNVYDQAGSTNTDVPDAEQNQPTDSLKDIFLNLPADQKSIWTAPFHLSVDDLPWVISIGSTTGVLIATDRDNLARERSDANAIELSDNIAKGGALFLAAVPSTMYVWGTINGSEHSRESGLLTGEALVNSLIVDEALKRTLGRERPTATDGSGHFFQEFANPSFPSDHAMLSWTAASVLAHEYPGILPQTLFYGAASAVSVARVTGREHFPSDVVVGGVLGWLIGRQTYKLRHDKSLDDLQFGHFVSERGHFVGPQTGTTSVPLDSWVYSAFDRLIALGFIDSASVGLRPWTRDECARLVSEAEISAGSEIHDLSAETVRSLVAEFSPELNHSDVAPTFRIEDAYARLGAIAGTPLADDYHFAKTVTDDFGRPFGQGGNGLVGAAVRSVVGPFAFYVRGEYQHAAGLPGEPLVAEQIVGLLEGHPPVPGERTETVDQIQFLDTYVSFNFHNNVLSFGKQSLWWGPGADGPFLESNNADPVPMLRFSRASPFVLPWLFKLMGPIRLEAFWGELGGQQFVALRSATGSIQVVPAPLHPHPDIQGAKFSFKPTSNLEFGFGETTIFSGPGFPLTLHTILRSYSLGNTLPGLADDPGDRRSAFDFSYRIPGLRKWLTLYSDSFTEDEFSPISFPRKSSFRSGLYAPQLPKLSKVDLRVEGIYTDIPNLGAAGVEYFNNHYLSGYTNYGQIIGNAIGREGRGLNVWTTYRFSSRDSVQFHYRNQRVNPEFLEGGYLRDFGLTGTLTKMRSMVLSGAVQYERWNFPLLAPLPQNNLTLSLQLNFNPVHGWNPFSQEHLLGNPK